MKFNYLNLPKCKYMCFYPSLKSLYFSISNRYIIIAFCGNLLKISQNIPQSGPYPLPKYQILSIYHIQINSTDLFIQHVKMSIYIAFFGPQFRLIYLLNALSSQIRSNCDRKFSYLSYWWYKYHTCTIKICSTMFSSNKSVQIHKK